jgi:hypothetical protein
MEVARKRGSQEEGQKEREVASKRVRKENRQTGEGKAEKRRN